MSELWIRSQDKEKLVKVENLTTSQGYENQFDGKSLLTYRGIVLGVYESQSRCIEILDEIQKLMLSICEIENHQGTTEAFGTGVITLSAQPDIEVVSMPFIVYEMPEK